MLQQVCDKVIEYDWELNIFFVDQDFRQGEQRQTVHSIRELWGTRTSITKRTKIVKVL